VSGHLHTAIRDFIEHRHTLSDLLPLLTHPNVSKHPDCSRVRYAPTAAAVLVTPIEGHSSILGPVILSSAENRFAGIYGRLQLPSTLAKPGLADH
jgi:hypothetical protein